jgi:hypothetical protein
MIVPPAVFGVYTGGHVNGAMIEYPFTLWSLAMRSTWTLFALFGFPLHAFADAVAFEDSVLLSPMFVSASQSYQIKKQSCEIGGLFTRGNLVSKTIDLTLEAKSQGAGFHCGQSLDENSLVIGIKGDIQQYTMDGVIMRFEDLTTNYEPYIAFQLSPVFSFSVSQEIEANESKNNSGNFSSNTQRLLLGGTWHEGPWEVTLSYADRYRDSENPGFDIPRSTTFVSRYQVSPLLSAGFIYSRTDYPGIASNGKSKEIGEDFVGSIASRMTDDINIELSYMLATNTEGNTDENAGIMALVGEYKLGSGVKIGASLNQYKSTNDAFDISMTAFGVSLGISR